MEVPNAGEVG